MLNDFLNTHAVVIAFLVIVGLAVYAYIRVMVACDQISEMYHDWFKEEDDAE